MKKRVKILIFVVLLLVVSISAILFFTQQSILGYGTINGKSYKQEFESSDYEKSVRIDWNDKPDPTEQKGYTTFSFGNYEFTKDITWTSNSNYKNNGGGKYIIFEKVKLSDGRTIQKGDTSCSLSRTYGSVSKGTIITFSDYESSDKTYCSQITNYPVNDYILMKTYTSWRDKSSSSSQTFDTNDIAKFKLNTSEVYLYSEVLNDPIIYLDEPQNISVKIHNDYSDSFLFDINVELKENGIIGESTKNENKVTDITGNSDYTVSISPTEFKEGCIYVKSTIRVFKDMSGYDGREEDNNPYYLADTKEYTINKTVCIIEKELTQEEFEQKYAEEILLYLAKNQPEEFDENITIEDVEEETIEEVYEQFQEGNTEIVSDNNSEDSNTTIILWIIITVVMFGAIMIYYKVNKKQHKRR